ncbi:MAG TPA: transglycosylase SLT domain-containing protein, partial [bacterium]|nr:transglycosylase SLT domain-containing protein [bacterium]
MMISFLRRLTLTLFLCLLSPSLWSLDSAFQQGYEAFSRRDYAAANAALAKAKSAAGHALHDYYLWALGRSRLELGDTAGGLKALEELVKQEPGSLWVDPAKIQIARGLRERGEIPEAKRRLEELLPSLPEAWKGEALLQLGLTEAAAGNQEAALKRFRELEVDYPASAAADRLAEERGKLALPAPALSAAEQLRRADRLFEAKSYTEALAAYDAAGGESGAVARVKKGESLYALRRYGASLPYLEPGAGVPPDLARSALLHRGMALLRSGNEAGSIAEFEKVQRLYPGTVEGEEALYRAGMVQHQAGRFSEAAVFFDRLAQAYPQGNFRDKGLWAAAWTAYRKDDGTTAKRWLEAMQQGASDGATRGKALYWLGRIAEREGKKTEAEAYWKTAGQVAPFSYYGFMALKRLQNSEDLSKTPQIPAEWRKTAAPASSAAKTAAELHFHKAVALSEAGLGRFAQAELDAAIEKSEGDPQGRGRLLELAKGSHAYFIPVQFGQKYWDKLKVAFADNASAESFRTYMMYPFAYRSLVEKSASHQGLPPALVVALMRQESAFMPWISSSANARGLMQLLPATANMRAKAAGIPAGDLFDPTYNIQVGTAELKAMLDRFGGSWPLAFSAYNAGPGRAKEWSASFGQLKTDEFIEEIPFAETN